MYSRELRRAELFRLKELVEFKPEILAGWEALTCDLRLADASLKSPEKVARKLRRELYIRVLLGYEKRDLRSGSVSWGGITFKLVLLPLWVGTYRYRGKRYPLLVNGAQMWFYFSRMRPREYEPVGVEAEGSATDLFYPIA